MCVFSELGNEEEKKSRDHKSDEGVKHGGARPLHEFTESEVPGSQSGAGL